MWAWRAESPRSSGFFWSLISFQRAEKRVYTENAFLEQVTEDCHTFYPWILRHEGGSWRLVRMTGGI
jgi:hypothetical protein